MSNDRALADELIRQHFTATAALIALMLKNLPDDVRTRTLDAAYNGTGKVELRTRVEASETELVLVPVDGTEPLWVTRAQK
jgi:hypothetical protein